MDDVLGELRWPAGARRPSCPRPTAASSTCCWRALGDDPAGIDTLAARLGQGAAEVQGQLLSLEMARLVERLPGGMFQRFRG